MNGLAALVTALSTDKLQYKVGEIPTYILQNAQPGSIVKWSSFRDGQSTGEYEEDYGGVIGNEGWAELDGGAWTTDHIGNWQKIALVIAPDGSRKTAQTKFSVSEVAATTTAPAPAAQNWFAGNFDIPLGANTFSINRGAGLLIGGLGLLALSGQFSGKKR